MTTVDRRNDGYLARLVVGDPLLELESADAALVVVYADGRGSRLVNRAPLEFERVGDELHVRDGKGRQWQLLGYCAGNPFSPTLVRWETSGRQDPGGADRGSHE